MIETLLFNNKYYPKFQIEGNSAQFAMPYAKHLCKGYGVDIGCSKPEWAFPDAKLVDPLLDSNYDALNFPYEHLDYIFSSHCLEHVHPWVDAMNYWYGKLKTGGVLFLYLPDYSQEYWRPWNNRKHFNIFTPQIIEDYMIDRGYTNVFKSGIDLNNSFMITGQK